MVKDFYFLFNIVISVVVAFCTWQEIDWPPSPYNRWVILYVTATLVGATIARLRYEHEKESQ